MNDLEISETRVVAESPRHGPEIIAELNRLREHEHEILKAWAADDHEARILRFALSDIEDAAAAEGRPAIAHMAREARGKTAERTSNIKTLIDAAIALDIRFGPHTNEAEQALREAVAPFQASR